MATKGLFVGIDRHADAMIRDLNGAARDATALFALLNDSIEDLQATLLRDGQATHAVVQHAIAEILANATPDDVIIISFAGHGTQDHRLVVSDTSVERIPETTIDMAAIAESFRQSPARSVLFLLDCCFSGGATARVLDLGLAARGTPLQHVAGHGRIMFAASMPDQEAFEDPVTRHGLFTGAIVETLSAATDRVSVIAMVDQVQAHVRVSAGRMGYSQDPVIFGHIEGGLTLPPGRKGSSWVQHFPRYATATLTGPFDELIACGMPKDAVQAWSDRFPGLNDLQLRAANAFGVLEGNSLLVVAPTSAGKTFVGEMSAIKTIAEGKKAIFLLPYKALVNEKYEDFELLYGTALGLRVVRCSGDWQDQVGDVLRGKYDIAFFTYEKFLSMSLTAPGLLNQIGLVVVDEAQFVTEPGRGMVVELLLTQLVSARARGVAPQIIALSAVIGETRGFERWLGAALLMTTERPVPLTEGVMDRSGVWKFRNQDGSEHEQHLLDSGAVGVRRDKPSSQDMIVPLVKKLVGAGEKVLIFRSTRGDAIGASRYLARELGLGPAAAALALLPDVDTSSSSAELRSALEGSVAFHHSDLNRDERIVIERGFRQAEGGIQVLVSTSTLAAGINTPASTVIIVETDFRSANGPQPYTVAQFKNMAGRAGRLGFEAKGKAIALADNRLDGDAKFRKYIAGRAEAITSSFDPANPGTWVLRLLAQVSKVPRASVPDLLANTFGGYLQALADPTWQTGMRDQIDGLLDRLLEAGLIVEEFGLLQLTMLGRACGQSPLTLESALRLIGLLRRLPSNMYNAMNLVVLVQALDELDQSYTPQVKAGEPQWRTETVELFGYDSMDLLRYGAADNRAFYARCKRACLLHAWISGEAISDIEARFTRNPYFPVRSGDVVRNADTTRFILESARQIASALSADPEVWGETDQVLRRLETGLPDQGLEFVGSPLALRRGEILGLLQHGITAKTELATLSVEALRTIVGNRASQIARLLHPEGNLLDAVAP